MRRIRWQQWGALVREVRPPIGGSFRFCRLCGHCEKTGKGAGRGFGMREGNKARGRMIQHLKTAHPAEYAAALTND